MKILTPRYLMQADTIEISAMPAISELQNKEDIQIRSH
jgi:hypothetical protein